MLSEAMKAEGWIEPAPLQKMLGRPVFYQNDDAIPVVRMKAWLDGIDEGWAIVEFSDNSRATVRPSHIIAYKPEATHD